MNKNKYIHSISVSSKPQTFPKPSLISKEEVEQELKKKGLDIKITETLKGGFVSQVYGACLTINLLL